MRNGEEIASLGVLGGERGVVCKPLGERLAQTLDAAGIAIEDADALERIGERSSAQGIQIALDLRHAGFDFIESVSGAMDGHGQVLSGGRLTSQDVEYLRSKLPDLGIAEGAQPEYTHEQGMRSADAPEGLYIGKLTDAEL